MSVGPEQSSDPNLTSRRINKALAPTPEEWACIHVHSIKVTPLAFESLGVRSMCTLVKTEDVTVLLDAGVALGPRFRLMPHPLEYRARDEARRRIEDAAKIAKIITISHYHNDHHTPNFPDPVWLGNGVDSLKSIYKGKTVLVKDPRRRINPAQRRRGWMFRQAAQQFVEKLEVADGRSFEFGNTILSFPGPVPHGEDESSLGWVLPCVIKKGSEKLFYAPDVQGPVVRGTLELILKEEPEMLIMGGPPTYLKGFRIGEAFFEAALRNMEELAQEIPLTVVDHHLLRDRGWSDFVEPVRKAARNAKHRVLTAAELIRIEPSPMECIRQQLYEEKKPTSEFMTWAGLSEEKQKLQSPPL